MQIPSHTEHDKPCVRGIACIQSIVTMVSYKSSRLLANRIAYKRSQSNRQTSAWIGLSSLIVLSQGLRPSSRGNYSSSTNLLAIWPKKGTSNLSSMSASRYAFRVKKAIRPRSQRKSSHPKNTDHEKTRWMMKTAVNRSADCQAWNLLCVSCGRAERPRQNPSGWHIVGVKAVSDLPDVVALPLQDQQHNGPKRRQRQVSQACLVVQPDAQARVELVDTFPVGSQATAYVAKVSIR